MPDRTVNLIFILLGLLYTLTLETISDSKEESFNLAIGIPHGERYPHWNRDNQESMRLQYGLQRD